MTDRMKDWSAISAVPGTSSSADFTTASILEAYRKIKEQTDKLPTLEGDYYVCLHDTWIKLKKELTEDLSVNQLALWRIPIYVFATKAEAIGFAAEMVTKGKRGVFIEG